MNSHRFGFFLTFISILALATFIRLWMASHWSSNFDSDEAMFGLVARHIMEGQFSPYTYGQNYLGSLEASLAALLMTLFGPSVMMLRLSGIIPVVVFIALFGLLVNRHWGAAAALIVMTALAIPGWPMLIWIYRSVSVFGSLFTMGTIALLVVLPKSPPRSFSWWRPWLLGLAFGVGLWAHPVMIVYIFIVAVIILLISPEWARLYQIFVDLCRRVGIPGILVPLVVTGIFSIFLVEFFFLKPAGSSGNIKILSLMALTGSGLLFELFWISKRRKEVIMGGALLACGFIIGNLPQWGFWVFGHVRPDLGSGGAPTLSLREILWIILGEVVPSTWGLPPLRDISGYIAPPMLSIWHRPALEMAFWLLTYLLLTASVCYFLWVHRRTVLSLLTLKPLSHEQAKYAVLLLMFFLPIVAHLFSGKTSGLSNVRNIALSWQAGAVILALLIVKITARSRILGVAAFLAIFPIVSLSNMLDIHHRLKRVEPFSADNLRGLRSYMAEHHLARSYADFWYAYALTFIHEEKLIFTAHNHEDPYPAYSQAIALQDTQMYAFFAPDAELPAEYKFSDLIRWMGEWHCMGSALPVNLARLKRQFLLERNQIGDWDVWLVCDSSTIAAASSNSYE